MAMPSPPEDHKQEEEQEEQEDREEQGADIPSQITNVVGKGAFGAVKRLAGVIARPFAEWGSETWGGIKNGLEQGSVARAIGYGLAGFLFTGPVKALRGVGEGLVTKGTDGMVQTVQDNIGDGNLAKDSGKAIIAGLAGIGYGVRSLLGIPTRIVAGAVGLISGFAKTMTYDLFKIAARNVQKVFKSKGGGWKGFGWAALEFCKQCVATPFRALGNIGFPIPLLAYGKRPDGTSGWKVADAWSTAWRNGASGLKHGLEGDALLPDALTPAKPRSFLASLSGAFLGLGASSPDSMEADRIHRKFDPKAAKETEDFWKKVGFEPERATGKVQRDTPGTTPGTGSQLSGALSAASTAHESARTTATVGASAVPGLRHMQSAAQTATQSALNTAQSIPVDLVEKVRKKFTGDVEISDKHIKGKEMIAAYETVVTERPTQTFTLHIPTSGRTREKAVELAQKTLADVRSKEGITHVKIGDEEPLPVRDGKIIETPSAAATATATVSPPPPDVRDTTRGPGGRR